MRSGHKEKWNKKLKMWNLCKYLLVLNLYLSFSFQLKNLDQVNEIHIGLPLALSHTIADWSYNDDEFQRRPHSLVQSVPNYAILRFVRFKIAVIS
jgi:hypothetical protein